MFCIRWYLFFHLLRLVQNFWVIVSLLVLQKKCLRSSSPQKTARINSEGKDHKAIFVEERPVLGIWTSQSWPLLFLMKSSLHQCLTFYCIIASLNSFSCLPQAELAFPLSLISTIISTLDETLLCAAQQTINLHICFLCSSRATEPSREVKRKIIFPLFKLKHRDHNT